MSKNKATSIDAALISGADLPSAPDVQSKSVGDSPKARPRKVKEIQGLKKIMKTTLGKMDQGLRV